MHPYPLSFGSRHVLARKIGAEGKFAVPPVDEHEELYEPILKKLREHLDDVPLFCDLLEHYLEILNAVAIKQYTGRLMKLSLMSISKQTPTDSLGDPSKYIRTKSGETFVSLLNLVSIKPFETSSSRASACLLRSHRLLWLLCLRLHLCRGPRLILCDWRHLGFRPGPGSWCGRHLHH